VSWRDGNQSLRALGLWTWNSLTFSGGADAERVDAAAVTANLFQLLGVEPVLGRGFSAEDETPNGQPVVLLSHALWRRRFGGDPAVLGTAVQVNAKPFVVIGVMPPGFAFPQQGQAWVPMLLDDPNAGRSNRSAIFGVRFSYSSARWGWSCWWPARTSGT
jgi:hypothetical protein